jgi:uncharacterized Zn finger protein
MAVYIDEFPPYVPVAERRYRAQKALAALAKKGGFTAQPVRIEGRAIAKTEWGQRWCAHLEGYADFASRLERGRTYARNGSVVHLAHTPGGLEAKVSGSELYDVTVTVKALPAPRWKALVEACAGQVASLVELLGGKLAAPVMEVLCHKEKGLFPSPKEIEFDCSCPDGASMCKHVAAVLYGVGARLDTAPELLFTLRQVDGAKLVSRAAKGLASKARAPARALKAKGEELAGLFGIELAGAEAEGPGEAKPAPEKPRRAAGPLRRAQGTDAPTRAVRAVRAAATPKTAQRKRKGAAAPAARRSPPRSKRR